MSILWYVHAAVLAIIFINLLEKLKIPSSFILGIAFLLYFLGLMGQSYYNIFTELPILRIKVINNLGHSFCKLFGDATTRHGLFFGFPFVYLGMKLARHKGSIKLLHSTILFIISMGFGLLEAIIGLKFDLGIRWDLMIFILPATISLFCILLTYSLNIKADTTIFRMLSSDIYFIHGVLIVLYTYYNLHFHSMVYFFIILLGSITLSFAKIIMMYICKRRKLDAR